VRQEMNADFDRLEYQNEWSDTSPCDIWERIGAKPC